MIRAKNYEGVSKFVKVMHRMSKFVKVMRRILWPLFSGHGVVGCLHNNNAHFPYKSEF